MKVAPDFQAQTGNMYAGPRIGAKTNGNNFAWESCCEKVSSTEYIESPELAQHRHGTLVIPNLGNCAAVDSDVAFVRDESFRRIRTVAGSRTAE